ncbi:MAG TPA: ketol-acid reductoisomerase [Candidatus Krumholzibacteria bacterium]|nr:ketol-acid reductoisomerase [Candidatus Krumholzibacteria bacterium]
MNVYAHHDLKQNLLDGATVAVLGFGNQGHAHALNLRDSGARVVVGARRNGAGWKAAKAADFETLPIGDATARADVVVMLLPDEEQASVFASEVAPSLREGAVLVFAHGFMVAFGGLNTGSSHDVVLVAPKGQGHFLRREYQAGRSVPCMVGVETDISGRALQWALSYASHLGCLRAGAIATSFREEAITDMFGEQAVLCGGVPALVKAAFETLVAKGYSPEVAYIECLQELKIIADLMYEGGLADMRARISKTAAWGSFESGPRLVTDATRRALESILDDIESGRFASQWLEEARAGQRTLAARMHEEETHPIEKAGRAVRALMRRSDGKSNKEST